MSERLDRARRLFVAGTMSRGLNTVFHFQHADEVLYLKADKGVDGVPFGQWKQVRQRRAIRCPKLLCGKILMVTVSRNYDQPQECRVCPHCNAHFWIYFDNKTLAELKAEYKREENA